MKPLFTDKEICATTSRMHNMGTFMHSYMYNADIDGQLYHRGMHKTN